MSSLYAEEKKLSQDEMKAIKSAEKAMKAEKLNWEFDKIEFNKKEEVYYIYYKTPDKEIALVGKRIIAVYKNQKMKAIVLGRF